MKLISWNVNGLRACIGKGFLDFVDFIDADVICLQETKLQPTQIELDLPQYHIYWNSADKKGLFRHGGLQSASRSPSRMTSARIFTATRGASSPVNTRTSTSSGFHTKLPGRAARRYFVPHGVGGRVAAVPFASLTTSSPLSTAAT